MKILIEEHLYQAKDIEEVIDGITTLRDINGKIAVNHVGYYYNSKLKDCVFILPKVILGNVKDEELVFGQYKPEEIISFESQKKLTPTEYEFIYELSVWIYHAISLYHDTHSKSNIVLQQNVQQMSKGKMRLKHNTFLDILLAIQEFNRENQNFFFFILRNIHSGHNKINWNRTISTTNAIIQDQNPIYLNPVNKKRQINFDEELLVIFFSILNYINKHYGFPATINVNFPLITDHKFEHYLNGFGKKRLLNIKHKYFTDKHLYLWELCYAFFDKSKEINIDINKHEYLLVKNFNIVFEDMIDTLISDKNIPTELKEQKDGKIVDHIYKDQSIIEDNNDIYFIGDSKYYKETTQPSENSIYKQFTYAKNVIQYNINLFNNEPNNNSSCRYRDPLTEGYSITPNFFIRGKIDFDNPKNQKQKIEKDETFKQHNEHFFNRLFDRDTLFLQSYGINFMFVIASYVHNSDEITLKNSLRKMFRNNFIEFIENKFQFYVLEPRKGIILTNAVERHFKKLIGKIYQPNNYSNLLIMALDKDAKYQMENLSLVSNIRQDFHIYEYHLGADPKEVLKTNPYSNPMAAEPQESDVQSNPVEEFEYRSSDD